MREERFQSLLSSVKEMNAIKRGEKKPARVTKRELTDAKDFDYTVGSGNVFADLGLPNPEERQLKVKIASLIYDVIEERGWTQKHSAEVLGITQPDVSKLTRGILKTFQWKDRFTF